MIARLAVAAWLVAGCGRFGFEAQDNGDGGDLIDAPAMDAPAGGDGATGADAALDGDGAACPSVCSRCEAGVCIIDGDALSGAIDCPAGWPCEVNCVVSGACQSVVRCDDASSCVVKCDGDGACFFGVQCGPGPCAISCGGAGACGGLDCADAASCSVTCGGEGACQFSTRCTTDCSVTCTGLDSCAGGVACSSACACDVTCQAAARCPDPPGFINCPSGCDTADGCTRTGAGCNTCP